MSLSNGVFILHRQLSYMIEQSVHRAHLANYNADSAVRYSEQIAVLRWQLVALRVMVRLLEREERLTPRESADFALVLGTAR